jgi:hypothetical protein
LQARDTLANLLLEKGEPAEAHEIANDVSERRRRVLGLPHSQTHQSMETLGETLLAMGRADEAETVLREAMDLRQKVGRKSAYGAHLLGGALAAKGHFAEAEPLLVDGYKAYLGNWGFTRARRLRAVDRIIGLYEAWGRPERAGEWRQIRMDWMVPSDPFAR